MNSHIPTSLFQDVASYFIDCHFFPSLQQKKAGLFSYQTSHKFSANISLYKSETRNSFFKIAQWQIDSYLNQEQ